MSHVLKLNKAYIDCFPTQYWHQLGEYNLDHTGYCNYCGTRLHCHFSQSRQYFGRRRIPIRTT